MLMRAWPIISARTRNGGEGGQLASSQLGQVGVDPHTQRSEDGGAPPLHAHIAQTATCHSVDESSIIIISIATTGVVALLSAEIFARRQPLVVRRR